ncbi:MAG: polyprenyl synthetase family protein [Planctomycetota bacterium]|nr:polyprenyl synthetase family protein [Planctomycetota bacterium]MDI6786754.1 polyprenyl synthetase family protein [Planctomycetota bacterium]
MIKHISKILARDLKRFEHYLKKVVLSANGCPDLSTFRGFKRQEGRPECFRGALATHFNNFQGKRLRPILTMLSAKAVAPDKNLDTGLFDVAVIVELLHNAALVHDDVLDEARLRRNTSTYNRIWGNEIAVIFGDYLFARLFSHIIRIKPSELLKSISNTTNQICLGELKHLLRRFDPYALSEDEYMEIIDQKTASLFALSTYAGASLSTTNKKVISALKEYGRNFGMAYQIMDDYKDIVTSDKTSGKSTGNDLFNGKITLPIIRAIRTASKINRAKIKSILSSVIPNGTSLHKGGWSDRFAEFIPPSAGLTARKKKLHRLLEQCGSLDYTLHQAQYYVNSAVRNLEILNQTLYKGLLTKIANFLSDKSDRYKNL